MCGTLNAEPDVVPAKAGTHLSSAGAAEPWIPAFAGMTPNRGSAAAVFGVEMRQDLLSHHLDDPQDLGGFHTGPAHPEDQVVGLEAADPLLDLLDDLVGGAED